MSALTPDQLTLVERLLRQQIGLQPERVGHDRIDQAVGERLGRIGLDVHAYLDQLLTGPDEMLALVDAVVVPETWFFRDRQAFRCLRRQLQALRAQAPTGPLRALSVPCCTGEEPYSIVMVALDAGVAAADLQVVAVDVSPAALAAAATGVYSELSFRATEPEFAALRDRFCRRDGQRYGVADEVRGAVRFLAANLAGAHFLNDEPPFHAIFCRNLFIYLDDAAQRTALAHMRRLLLPGGFLYFSAVEAGAIVKSGFRTASEEYPFVFVKEALSPAPTGTPRSGRKSLHRGRRAPAGRTAPLRRAAAPVPQEPAEADESQTALAQARQAADAGRLEEGASLCAKLVADGPPRPDVFCLLGVVRQAQGNFADAERWFQRALYLDPRHTEALVHMALLARGRGDERQAERYFHRAGRTGEGD